MKAHFVKFFLPLIQLTVLVSAFAGGIPNLHEKGTLTAETKQVFECLGQEVKTLEEANAFSQKHLLRRGERWDKQEETEVRTLCAEKKAELLELLKPLGMVDAIKPLHKKYVYALLMGATAVSVQGRLDDAAQLQDEGYSFDHFVLLGGERELRDDEKKMVAGDITTEAQMMQHLCRKHAKLKAGDIILVNAPMVKKGEKLVRPNTDDTLVHFAKVAPCDGSCLVISNNPYTVRQTKVAQRVLDQERFPTDGCGRTLDAEQVDIGRVMDEFARTLYEEMQSQ